MHEHQHKSSKQASTQEKHVKVSVNSLLFFDAFVEETNFLNVLLEVEIAELGLYLEVNP